MFKMWFKILLDVFLINHYYCFHESKESQYSYIRGNIILIDLIYCKSDTIGEL